MRGRNKSVIGCLTRNHISILVQNANLAPRNAFWCVIRQCINFIDIEPEARAELVALSFLAINRARDILVAEDDVAFAIDEATEIILVKTRKLSFVSYNLAFCPLAHCNRERQISGAFLLPTACPAAKATMDRMKALNCIFTEPVVALLCLKWC